MNKSVVKWAAGLLTILGLAAFVGNSAIRLSDMEKRTDEVEPIKQNQKIMLVYMKLQNPVLFHKAEELAK